MAAAEAVLLGVIMVVAVVVVVVRTNRACRNEEQCVV